jgi:hypothetical protein
MGRLPRRLLMMPCVLGLVVGDESYCDSLV